ncbi:ATP-grasp domain-containing protein [Planotetraspora kaengkrachanensis]|uniref:Carboxylate--amine ligase n=1 Tax=Planotetraspora kaengkrachanensis TaxID=575193 RepID=A0A8J3LYC7_9ACTN|nr:ATP-grasp domain-containing protein [Planotetraspora kaengkrachanensis]GIG80129.1 carboxylate--amine ligase [Planotetraspora kaengkrachanensis]
MRLYLTALNPTDSVMDGFLPAAAALGWDVTVLTDQPDGYPGHEVIETDVRDPRAVIDVISAHHRPDVVFSNSDHLQAETALAAGYFGLPGKDWRSCVTAKNKVLMRRHLAPVETVRSVRLPPGADLPEALPYPVVVKPAAGVASEDVTLAADVHELAAAVSEIRKRRPADVLVAEEFLDGSLHTLETLGDGRTLHVLGGFRTTLGPLPHFVEERLDWHADPGDEDVAHVTAALGAIGAGFGVCHTEYMVTRHGPRIVEINYRLIGDNCDFLLGDLLGAPLHEWVLRVHAGEPLDALGVGDAPRGDLFGTAVSLIADRPGVVTAAPPPVSPDGPSGDPSRVRLWHRPLRAVGDRVEVTHTNRDYLGIVRAIGPDRTAVDSAVGSFRALQPWTIA